MNELVCLGSRLAEATRSLRSCISILATALVFLILGFSGQAHAALQVNNATLSVASPAQGPASVVYITGGGTITANVNVSTLGNTNWSSTLWQIGAGPAICNNSTNFNGNNSSATLSFPITAPAAAGSYDVSFIAYRSNNCSFGQSNNTLVLKASVVVDNTPPTVSSINLASANPSSAASVSWTVIFSENVVGLTASNFTPVPGGGLTGAAITSITGSGTTWTVTASTGSGSGTLGLNLSNASGITDLAGNALTGAPVTGPIYNVNGSTLISVQSSPGSCGNVTGIGTQPWTPNGINLPATASVSRNATTTNYLRCSNYGFNIPSNAIITGIVVGVSRYNAARGNIVDAAMRLVDATGAIGADRSTTTVYPTNTTTGTNEDHGTSSDLWGTTGTYLTPAIINSASFGAEFASQYTGNRNSGHTVGVVGMPITIYYKIAASPDHLEIQSAASGLTCAYNTLTVVACADNASPCTPYTSGVSGTLSATGGTVNWDGSTGGVGATGAGFVISAGSSSVTKNVQVSVAGVPVTFSVATASPAPTGATPVTCNFGGSPACTFTAYTAGFIFSSTTTGNSYTIPPQVSGIATPALYLRAVQASTTNPAVCTPAIIGQTAAVNMGYTCNNPASCQTGNLVTITNTATSTATAIAPGGTSVSLDFDPNGSAPITARYDDAGQITLNASTTVTPFTGAAAITLNGSSNPFVVAPDHFDLSAITAGPIKAGNPFSATITARNALGNTTPNFGKESPTEGVTLTSNLVTPDPVTYPAASNPALGNNVIAGLEFGAGGMVNDANGVATVNNLNWGEVGSITLTANLTSKSYLGSGLNATGTSATVGAFIPDHFDTAVVATATTPMPCPAGLACPSLYNGFVYSGQPFSIQVTAKNLSGVTTANYDSNYGLSNNVTLSAWDALGSVVMPNPPGGANPGVLGSGMLASTTFNLGAGLTSAQTYTFATSPTTPTNIFLRAEDAVNATVSSRLTTNPANSVEGGVQVVSGKVKISNAYGSELLPLPLTATIQYWNGTSWLASTTDSITQFNTNLSTAGGSIVATIVNGLGSGISVATPGVVTVAAGLKTFTLNQPGVSGSADISLNAPGYLLGGSNGAGVDPSKPGRATFGVYKGSSEFIYQREDY